MPQLVAFGEDLGQLGDVNQGFLGLQEKYGALRVADTGIRESTIIGQAIGLAMRGLRPIAEIQYLDYVLYGLQILSDDLATLRWRTAGRPEGAGHRAHPRPPARGDLALGLADGRASSTWCAASGVCVPRNMTQAAGMYNTLLAGDDPAIVVEVLNGYRQQGAAAGEHRRASACRSACPRCCAPGRDVTVVTYGACCRIVLEAAELLAARRRRGRGDRRPDAAAVRPRGPDPRRRSSKTNRAGVRRRGRPGRRFGLHAAADRSSAQGGFGWLDGRAAHRHRPEHRPAYGSDGDYFSKPHAKRSSAPSTPPSAKVRRAGCPR